MIVGIDYSMTSPAICCCVGEFNYENCSFMFVTNNKKKEGSWSPKIKGVPLYEYKDNTERFTKLANITMEFILSHPTAHIHTHDIAIEGYAFGAKGQVFNIGENTGILKFFLKRLNQELSVYAPSEIKKFATGKGNAKKELMYESFIEETGDDLAKLFGIDEYKGQGPVSDIIDSYYIAKYHHKLLNS